MGFLKMVNAASQRHFYLILFRPTVRFVNMMSAGMAFCCFIANKSSHQDEERQGHVGAGDTWADDRGCVDGNEYGRKKRQKWEKKLSLKRDVEKLEGRTQATNVDGKILPFSLVGGLHCSNALSEESSRDKQRREGEGGDRET